MGITLSVMGSDNQYHAINQYIALDGYTVSVQDVDVDTGRSTDSGIMIRHRKRGGDNAPRKIELVFRAGMNMSEIKEVHDLIKAESFQVKYTDPSRAGVVTGKFYCGDRTFPRHSDALDIWSAWTVNFVEY